MNIEWRAELISRLNDHVEGMQLPEHDTIVAWYGHSNIDVLQQLISCGPYFAVGICLAVNVLLGSPHMACSCGRRVATDENCFADQMWK